MIDGSKRRCEMCVNAFQEDKCACTREILFWPNYVQGLFHTGYIEANETSKHSRIEKWDANLDTVKSLI